jgi:hypothetical protein
MRRFEVTPSRLSKTTPSAEAALASADSEKDAAAHVATNVRNRMRFPNTTTPQSSLLHARREWQGHGNVRLQRPAAEALGGAWQACCAWDDGDGRRNKEEGGFRAPLLLRAVIGLTAGRGPLCLDTYVERNGSFHDVLSSTPA